MRAAWGNLLLHHLLLACISMCVHTIKGHLTGLSDASAWPNGASGSHPHVGIHTLIDLMAAVA